jgi:hypothetical protein
MLFIVYPKTPEANTIAKIAKHISGLVYGWISPKPIVIIVVTEK